MALGPRLLHYQHGAYDRVKKGEQGISERLHYGERRGEQGR